MVLDESRELTIEEGTFVDAPSERQIEESRMIKCCLIVWAMLGAIIPQSAFCSNDPLFGYLAKYTMLPYALVGHKPMAIEQICYKCQWNNDVRWMLAGWRMYPQLWMRKRLWKEFYSSFRQTDYSNFYLKEDSTGTVILFNKKNCLDLINANLDLFQAVCGNKSASIFLKELCDTDDIYTYIKNSNTLLGLLLGYGRKNAEKYEEYYCYCDLFPEPTDFNGFNPETYFDDDLLPYRLPDFRALKSEETETLRRIYEQDQREIAKIFSERDAKEIFLEYLEKN